jgi:hypothetical protein
MCLLGPFIFAQDERLLRCRDRCREMAETAPTEAIRISLLSVARLYEIEADLMDRAHSCLVQHKSRSVLKQPTNR